VPSNSFYPITILRLEQPYLCSTTRFSSVALDEPHLLAAIRYVAMNPVRARLVNRPEDWPFSSVRAHAGIAPDGLTVTAPVLARIPDFVGLLHQPADDPSFAVLRAAERLGRPLGSEAFKQALEARLGRSVRPRKRGRKKKKELQ
jgi:putative transposase